MRFVRTSSLLVSLIISGAAFAGSAPDNGSMQTAVNQLQQQVQSVSASIPKAIEKQSIVTQKSIVQLRVFTQKQLNAIQAQVQQVNASIAPKVKTETASVQKAIAQLQKITQQQIARLQSEIQTVQNTLNQEIKSVQNEVRQVASNK